MPFLVQSYYLEILMAKSNKEQEIQYLWMLIFLVVQLFRIISLLRGYLLYKNTKTLQELENHYICLHIGLLKLLKVISTNESEVSEFISLLSESGLLLHKTLGWYKDLALLWLLEAEFEEKFNLITDQIKFISVLNSLYSLNPPYFYTYWDTGDIVEFDDKKVKSLKYKITSHNSNVLHGNNQIDTEAMLDILNIETNISSLITTYKEEIKIIQGEVFPSTNAWLFFDPASWEVAIDGKVIWMLQNNTHPYYFFQILYERINKNVSYQEIIDQIPSIDEKRKSIGEKAGFCSNIKRQLPETVKELILSSKGHYKLSGEKTRPKYPVS